VVWQGRRGDPSPYADEGTDKIRALFLRILTYLFGCEKLPSF
jgi:hypothetical protein